MAYQASPAESSFAESLRQAFPERDRLFVAAGTLRLYELAALLANARLYIGPDAGPKHVAAATGTPVLELSWVPTNYPVTSRGSGTGGSCWTAWKTLTRIVYPATSVFERAMHSTDFMQTPICGIEATHVERAIEELLEATDRVTSSKPRAAPLGHT